MYRILNSLLFVPHCPACDMRVAPNAIFCPTCATSLYELGPACPCCAEPQERMSARRCHRCRSDPPPFALTHAPYRYGGELGQALRRLKYQRRPDIARTLAPLLRPSLARLAHRVDLAVPVPLDWRRRWQRGFNQAALLLRYAVRGLPQASTSRRFKIDTISLRKIRPTEPQRGLNLNTRTANMADAFAVAPRRRAHVRGCRIVIVDDVMTTGATMAACARALLAAGAAEVEALCLARTERTP